MRTELNEPVQYSLQLNEKLFMNDFLGKEIKLEWDGRIICCSCGIQTKKSFGEGFCYNCFVKAPEASECIIRPELCRAHLGEGRDIVWEQQHHNVPHVVYLAASDIVKVGVTRSTQIPTRWIDQGASAAIRLAETPNRFEAGILEVALKSFFSDKTNWQRMLKNEVDSSIDLVQEKWELHDQLPSDLTSYFSENDEVISLNYPVLAYPAKVVSLSFDKEPIVAGVLKGIKGQYLIFDNDKVFNIRKHSGYSIELTSL
ncbi:MAG: DUF2797 domain-containing protein [Flavobacteriia bacterium]